MNICEMVSRFDREYSEGKAVMLSLEIDSRRRIVGDDRMCLMDVLDPMNLNVHSGGMRFAM